MIPDPLDLGDDMADAVHALFAAADVWLQPLATVITGTLAVLAAAIAYRAVTRQIKANAGNVQKQIDANAHAVSRQIAADRSERRRAERVELAADAATMVTELAQIASAYETYSGKTGGSPNPDLQQSEFDKFYGLEVKVLATSRRMWLLSMPKSSEAVEAVYEQARIVIGPPPSDQPAAASTVEQKKNEASFTLKASLEQLVTPAQIHQGGQ